MCSTSVLRVARSYSFQGFLMEGMMKKVDEVAVMVLSVLFALGVIILAFILMVMFWQPW